MTRLHATSKGYPVGLLFSSSSLTAPAEMAQKQATLLAIDEVNEYGGIAGVPLFPVDTEIGPLPENYKKAAEHLCDEKQVRIIFGPHMSNTRKSVLPVVESKRALLLYPTMYEGFEYSQNCFYTGPAPNQSSVQLANHVVKNYGNRVVFVGSNYIFAHESNRIMRDLFEQAGGQVLDEMYFTLNSPEEDFERAIQHIIDLSPDTIYSTVVGNDTVKLYESFGRSALRKSAIRIVSLATNEIDVGAMSNDAAEGHISAAPYFESLGTPASRLFVDRYRQRFGGTSRVNSGAESAYFQVHVLAAAAKASPELTVENLIKHMGDTPFEAPQGVVQIDAKTHHTHLWPRIARINANAEFEIIETEEQSVRPIPYMIQHRLEVDAV